MRVDHKSLQFRMTVRLALVFALATVAITVVVIMESWETAAELDNDELAHALLGEFVSDIAWLIPVIALAALIMAGVTLRRALAPLRRISALAGYIGPQRTDIRLPESELPSEIKPLVTAFNQGLDRLDTAFDQQRRFTANAAHQLRTPLALLSANLDLLEGNGEIVALRADAARMTRLVNQLLRVARLEAQPLDVSRRVDLAACAHRAVSALAPLAVTQGRELALSGAEQPVYIKGNTDGIEEALRNLIENGLAHTPVGGVVTVTVDPGGAIIVTDQGPGVSEGDQAQLFERFWRGSNASAEGAGLGLSIVAEIMQFHGGRVSVDSGPCGGAMFTLLFNSTDQRSSRETQ